MVAYNRRRLLAAGGAAAIAGALTAWPTGRSTAQEAELPKFTFDEHLLVPVRVHLLSAANVPELHTTTKLADVERIFGKINRLIWNQAGIQLLVESVVAEEAQSQELYNALGANRTEAHLLTIRPRRTMAEKMLHVYYIHEMRPNGIFLRRDGLFVKDTAALRKVQGGIDEPLPRVTAHEVGHALTLPHRQDVTNLMASGTTGYSLNAAEVGQARKGTEAVGGTLTTAQAATEAAAAFEAKEWPRARALYSALKDTPGVSPLRGQAAARLRTIPQ